MAKVEMYVTGTCVYCVRARALLSEKGVSWEEHDITGRHGLMEEMVQRAGGRTTVPQIFIDGLHVGGFTDMRALDQEGRLDSLLGR